MWLYRGLDLPAAAQLRRRVQALHTVRHAGLVSVYDLVDHDDEVAVVTEVLSGRSVADLQRGSQRPSLGTARGIVSSLAEVLDELHRSGRTVSALSAADLLLRVDGVAILDAPLAAPEQSAARPDIQALEELARALVLGSPPRPDAPPAVRLAVDRVSGAQERFRSARDFAGNLASAITFDDRTEVLPRERWMVLRRAAAERARARTVAAALMLTVSLAAGGIVASAVTRTADRAVTRPAAATASPATTAPAAVLTATKQAPAAVPTATKQAITPVAVLPAKDAGTPPVAPSVGGRTVAPSVVGLARDDAARALLAAGAGSVIWRTDPMARGVTRVVRQEPVPGQPLARGATATVYLDSAKAR